MKWSSQLKERMNESPRSRFVWWVKRSEAEKKIKSLEKQLVEKNKREVRNAKLVSKLMKNFGGEDCLP